MSQRDGLVEGHGVGEQAADQLDVVGLDRYAEPCERLGHLVVEVIAVAVVRVPADATRGPAANGLVAPMDVGAVLVRGWGNHAEHVVDLHRPLDRLGRRQHDGGAAAGGAGLDDQTRRSAQIEPDGEPGERGQPLRLQVGQAFLADPGDGVLHRRRQLDPGVRVAQRGTGDAQLAAQLGVLFLGLGQFGPKASHPPLRFVGRRLQLGRIRWVLRSRRTSIAHHSARGGGATADNHGKGHHRTPRRQAPGVSPTDAGDGSADMPSPLSRSRWSRNRPLYSVLVRNSGSDGAAMIGPGSKE